MGSRPLFDIPPPLILLTFIEGACYLNMPRERCPHCWKTLTHVPLRPNKDNDLICKVCGYKRKTRRRPFKLDGAFEFVYPDSPEIRDNIAKQLENDYQSGKR